MRKYYEDAKAFGEKHLKPFTKDIDVQGRFPVEAYNALRENGYMGLVVPEEFGGQGKDIVEHAEVCIGLSESCASSALCYMMHNVGVRTISMYASEELKKDLLPKIAAGEITLGLAYSETGTGTHFYIPEMTEENKGDYSILSGTKSMVTAAGQADYYLTLAKNVEEDTANVWVVPANSEGLSFKEDVWDGVGMRGNESKPMVLDNIKIDNYYKMVGNGDGDREIFVVGLSSVCAGLAMHMVDASAEYVKSRTYSHASNLANIETVQTHLADMYTRAYAARETIYAAAQSGIDKDSDSFNHIIAARVNSTKAVLENATEGMRLFGGKGYVRHNLPMERLMRDAYAGQIMAPGIDVLRIWLGRLLVDLPYIDIFR
ncbi:acyl-CoA dehydrogenase family protein [Peptostreptococcus faecalis]|uniref:acyl-CoA dehydrogenase family protein n=1 Tax=Peptostreptococcus faecalis TaxID=2045015 RepID=UPI000C7E1716|nr:acyl-CoA dehydrogenase family protein [Peptostreptococcus faecalis]